MDCLAKKDDSMLLSHRPFVMQTDVQDFMGAQINRDSFRASDPVKLSIAQTHTIEALADSFARLLTPRETELLKFLGRGLSMKGTAREMCISPETVKWHVKNIYYKLGASSREDALHKARRRQLIL